MSLGLSSATACSGCPCVGCPFASVLSLWFSGVLRGSFLLLLLFGVSCLVALLFFALGLWVVAVWPALSWLAPSLPTPWLVLWRLLVQLVSAGLSLRASGCICKVQLSYRWYGVLWLIGSCLHSSSWQQRLPAVWALPSPPCWKCCAPRSCTEVFALG